MKKQRKHYTPEEKVAILRRHLVEGVPISDLCDEPGLQATVFYRWQKEFFENGAAAFQQRGRTNHQFKPLGILKSPHATTACGAPSRSSDPKPLVSGVTENGSGSKGLNVVQSRARNWGAEHMNVREQIKKYITSQP